MRLATYSTSYGSPTGTKEKQVTKSLRAQARVKGPSHPQHRPNGAFEAISFNNRTGRYVRTFHHSRAKAEKRLDGNRWHTYKSIVDHTNEIEAAAAAARKAAAKKGWIPEAQPATEEALAA